MASGYQWSCLWEFSILLLLDGKTKKPPTAVAAAGQTQALPHVPLGAALTQPTPQVTGPAQALLTAPRPHRDTTASKYVSFLPL